FGPTEQLQRIVATVSTPATNRRLLMDTHATQKYRLTVEQDLRASRFDTPKPDRLVHPISIHINPNVVELRILRRPQLQISIEIDRRETVRIGCKRFSNAFFSNPNHHLLLKLVAPEF